MNWKVTSLILANRNTIMVSEIISFVEVQYFNMAELMKVFDKFSLKSQLLVSFEKMISSNYSKLLKLANFVGQVLNQGNLLFSKVS